MSEIHKLNVIGEETSKEFIADMYSHTIDSKVLNQLKPRQKVLRPKLSNYFMDSKSDEYKEKLQKYFEARANDPLFSLKGSRLIKSVSEHSLNYYTNGKTSSKMSDEQKLIFEELVNDQTEKKNVKSRKEIEKRIRNVRSYLKQLNKPLEFMSELIANGEPERSDRPLNPMLTPRRLLEIEQQMTREYWKLSYALETQPVQPPPCFSPHFKLDGTKIFDLRQGTSLGHVLRKYPVRSIELKDNDLSDATAMALFSPVFDEADEDGGDMGGDSRNDNDETKDVYEPLNIRGRKSLRRIRIESNCVGVRVIELLARALIADFDLDCLELVRCGVGPDIDPFTVSSKSIYGSPLFQALTKKEVLGELSAPAASILPKSFGNAARECIKLQILLLEDEERLKEKQLREEWADEAEEIRREEEELLEEASTKEIRMIDELISQADNIQYSAPSPPITPSRAITHNLPSQTKRSRRDQGVRKQVNEDDIMTSNNLNKPISDNNDIINHFPNPTSYSSSNSSMSNPSSPTQIDSNIASHTRLKFDEETHNINSSSNEKSVRLLDDFKPPSKTTRRQKMLSSVAIEEPFEGRGRVTMDMEETPLSAKVQLGAASKSLQPKWMHEGHEHAFFDHTEDSKASIFVESPTKKLQTITQTGDDDNDDLDKLQKATKNSTNKSARFGELINEIDSPRTNILPEISSILTENEVTERKSLKAMALDNNESSQFRRPLPQGKSEIETQQGALKVALIAPLAFQLARSTTLRRLELGGNALSSSSWRWMRVILADCVSLEDLGLSYTDMTNDGLQALTDGIKVNATLKSLSIRSGAYNSEEVLISFLSAVTAHASISHLDMSEGLLWLTTIPSIIRLLLTNDSLSALHILKLNSNRSIRSALLGVLGITEPMETSHDSSEVILWRHRQYKGLRSWRLAANWPPAIPADGKPPCKSLRASRLGSHLSNPSVVRHELLSVLELIDVSAAAPSKALEKTILALKNDLHIEAISAHEDLFASVRSGKATLHERSIARELVLEQQRELRRTYKMAVHGSISDNELGSSGKGVDSDENDSPDALGEALIKKNASQNGGRRVNSVSSALLMNSQEMIIQDKCYICEKWKAHKFEWRVPLAGPMPLSPLLLRLSCFNWEPIMTVREGRSGDCVVLSRSLILPAGPHYYVFEVDRKLRLALNHKCVSARNSKGLYGNDELLDDEDSLNGLSFDEMKCFRKIRSFKLELMKRANERLSAKEQEVEEAFQMESNLRNLNLIVKDIQLRFSRTGIAHLQPFKISAEGYINEIQLAGVIAAINRSLKVTQAQVLPYFSPPLRDCIPDLDEHGKPIFTVPNQSTSPVDIKSLMNNAKSQKGMTNVLFTIPADPCCSGPFPRSANHSFLFATHVHEIIISTETEFPSSSIDPNVLSESANGLPDDLRDLIIKAKGDATLISARLDALRNALPNIAANEMKVADKVSHIANMLISGDLPPSSNSASKSSSAMQSKRKNSKGIVENMAEQKINNTSSNSVSNLANSMNKSNKSVAIEGGDLNPLKKSSLRRSSTTDQIGVSTPEKTKKNEEKAKDSRKSTLTQCKSGSELKQMLRKPGSLGDALDIDESQIGDLIVQSCNKNLATKLIEGVPNSELATHEFKRRIQLYNSCLNFDFSKMNWNKTTAAGIEPDIMSVMRDRILPLMEVWLIVSGRSEGFPYLAHLDVYELGLITGSLKASNVILTALRLVKGCSGVLAPKYQLAPTQIPIEEFQIPLMETFDLKHIPQASFGGKSESTLSLPLPLANRISLPKHQTKVASSNDDNHFEQAITDENVSASDLNASIDKSNNSFTENSSSDSKINPTSSSISNSRNERIRFLKLTRSQFWDFLLRLTHILYPPPPDIPDSALKSLFVESFRKLLDDVLIPSYLVPPLGGFPFHLLADPHLSSLSLDLSKTLNALRREFGQSMSSFIKLSQDLRVFDKSFTVRDVRSVYSLSKTPSVDPSTTPTGVSKGLNDKEFVEALARLAQVTYIASKKRKLEGGGSAADVLARVTTVARQNQVNATLRKALNSSKLRDWAQSKWLMQLESQRDKSIELNKKSDSLRKSKSFGATLISSPLFDLDAYRAEMANYDESKVEKLIQSTNNSLSRSQQSTPHNSRRRNMTPSVIDDNLVITGGPNAKEVSFSRQSTDPVSALNSSFSMKTNRLVASRSGVLPHIQNKNNVGESSSSSKLRNVQGSLIDQQASRAQNRRTSTLGLRPINSTSDGNQYSGVSKAIRGMFDVLESGPYTSKGLDLGRVALMGAMTEHDILKQRSSMASEGFFFETRSDTKRTNQGVLDDAEKKIAKVIADNFANLANKASLLVNEKEELNRIGSGTM